MKYKEDRAYLMESRNVFALRILFPNQKQRPTEARNVLNHYLVHGNSPICLTTTPLKW